MHDTYSTFSIDSFMDSVGKYRRFVYWIVYGEEDN